jgi:hypothetical protein
MAAAVRPTLLAVQASGIVDSVCNGAHTHARARRPPALIG